MRPQQVHPAATPSDTRRPLRARAIGVAMALLAIVSVLALTGATPSSALTGQSPVGSVDRLALTFVGATPTVAASGWSIDHDVPTTSIKVSLKVDGVFVTSARANLSRPDVAAAFPGVGAYHGYSLTRALAPGTHKVCAVGVNATGTGGANRTLACGTVIVLGVAGSIDSATQKDGVIRVSGWAIDGTKKAPAPVRISNGTNSVTVSASTGRADVGAAFPGYGSNHGYSATLPAGPSPVCVDLLDGLGAVKGRIGCRDVVNLDKPQPAPGWQDAMLSSVNLERSRRGAAPLVLCAALNRSAQGYADEMAFTGRFAHTGADNSQPWDRMMAAGYQWTTAGENLALGQSDVPSVMTAWVNSPGHYANIINPAFVHLGVGATPSPSGGWYWVQNFGAGGNCA